MQETVVEQLVLMRDFSNKRFWAQRGRGRVKELLPPDDRFQGFRHENESFIILFYMV